MRDNGLMHKAQPERRKPPRMVTIAGEILPKNARGLDHQYDDISQLSIDDCPSWSEIVYYKLHPIIWMLLMFMAVGVHSRYQDMHLEHQINRKMIHNHQHRRQQSEFNSTEQATAFTNNPSPDLSDLVMSLLQPDEQAEESPLILQRYMRPVDSTQDLRPQESSPTLSSTQTKNAVITQDASTTKSLETEENKPQLPFQPNDSTQFELFDEHLVDEVDQPVSSNRMLRGALLEGSLIRVEGPTSP